MKRHNVVFTLVDRLILESYKTVLAGISDYLGRGYEIVLHSLEDLDHSVVAIFNGERTGRQVGAPITDLALQMLAQISEKDTQDSVTYFNSADGEGPLKSATIVIRGERNRAIGLLCINFDMSIPVNTLLQEFIPSGENYPIQSVEVLAEHSDDLISSMLDEVSADVLGDDTISVVNRNKEIVWRLYEKGVFNLKNSVVYVAEKLGISRNTVYMHLRSLKSQRQNA